MVKRNASMAAKRPIVRATTAMVPPMATNTEFCVLTPGTIMVMNSTMKSESAISGTSSVIDVASTIIVATTTRMVAFSRPGAGASSARRSSSVMLALRRDQGDRRGADAEELRGRVLDADAHREALRDAHPVDRARHLRQAGRARAAFLRVDAEADRLHRAGEAPARIGHQIDLGPRAGVDALQHGLAEVGDDVPVA